MSHAFREYTRKNGIIQADTDSLKKLKKKFDKVVVYFYSRKCKNCKQLNKTFPSMIKDKLSFMEKNLVPVVRFSCDGSDEYCSSKEKITHFPCIRVYYNRKHYVTYFGKLQENLLVKWLTQRVFYSVHTLGESYYGIDHILKNSQLVVLKINRGSIGSVERYEDAEKGQPENEKVESEAFKILGLRMHHAHFYMSDNNELVKNEMDKHCPDLGVDEYAQSPFVLINSRENRCYLFEEVLYKKRYDDKLTVDESAIKKALSFISDHRKPLYTRFGEVTIDLHQSTESPIVIYFTSYGKGVSLYKDLNKYKSLCYIKNIFDIKWPY